MKLKKIIGEMSPVAKASYALMLAKFFEKGLAMISGPIFTRIMPQDEYGLISNYTSWQSILIIIATLSFASGVFNNGMMDFEKNRYQFMFSIQCLGNIVTLICLGILILFYGQLKSVLELPIVLIAVMFLRFLVAPAFSFWSCYQKYIYEYKLLTIITIMSSFVSVLMAVFVVIVEPTGMKAIGKICATEAIYIFLGIISYIYIAYKSNFKLELKYWGYALKFNLPLIPHFLATHVLSSADKIMITNISGSKETAIYSLAYTVASILLIVWTSVDAAYAPWIYEKMQQGKKQDIRRRGNMIICFMGVCSLISMLFAPEIIRILGTKEYYSGIYVIPSVCAGVFFTMIYTLYMRLELFCGKTILTMIGSVISALANIGLNFLFIPKFGFIAAGYTTMICYMLLSLLHYMNARRLKVSGNYDNKFICLIGTIVLLFSFVSTIIYQYTLFRWWCIGIILLCCIIWRKRIILWIKTLMKSK